MLQIQNLVTYHDQIHVLREISFGITQGDITAIIGANGAGKSTLMGSVIGLYPPRSGNCLFNGIPITHRSTEEIVALGISLVPERRQVFDSLTVRENLVLGAYHRIKRDRIGVKNDLEEVLQIFPPLRNMQQRMAGTLSGGEQQMVAIGRGLMSRPALLLLDEPSLGLAPLVIREIFNKLKQLRDERNTTILLVEQNARAALRIADRVLVMERGEICFAGQPAELLQNESIRSAYLGKKSDVK